MVIPNFWVKNRPDKLNYGLKFANKKIVVIFDAEDNPHKDIFNVVNTVMLRDDTDVVQSGVQLMNFRSKWFSALNVLKYFFWFKSVLHLFIQNGVVVLGGNTIFFKKNLLKKIGVWDSKMLTEDANIGIRGFCRCSKNMIGLNYLARTKNLQLSIF